MGPFEVNVSLVADEIPAILEIRRKQA